MLRQKQETEATGSEVACGKRKWGWFRGRNIKSPPTAQTEAVQAEMDAIEPRLTALQRAVYRRKRILRTTYLGAGMVASGLALILSTLPIPGHPQLGFPGFLIFGGEALILISLLCGEKAFRAAVNALAHTEDLRAIGPLAEALALGEPSYSHVVFALTRLLPRLQPSDAGLLNAMQYACLHRALAQSSRRLCFWRYNPHFAAVLRRALTTLDALAPTERSAGEDLIEQRPPDLERLLEQFQASVDQRQKNMRTIGVSAVSGATSALANIAVQAHGHPQYSPLLLWVALGSLGTTLTFSFGGLFRLKAMMNELANAGDLRVVGPLLEIAVLQDSGANAMAALLLTRLLPRLRASDATLLTDGQRAALGRTLTHHTGNPDFLLAALKALEQVGDGSALSVVESLATGKIRTAAPKRVQAAAQECLPFLQARYAQQQASETLLRASDISKTPSDTLLRPAQGVVARKDAELLRPGTPQPEREEVEVRRDEHVWFDLPQPVSTSCSV